MVVVGAIGGHCYMQDGLMYRLPKELQEAFDWNRYARVGSCTLNTNTDQTEQASICFESGRPLVALWGDSHAAALYPGLRRLQEKNNFGIIQVTQAGCPPVFDISIQRQNCDLINQKIFKKLIKLNPDTVILHSAWVLPEYENLNDEEFFKSKVSDTVVAIRRELPGSEIILVGPFPRWKNPPLQRIVSEWRMVFKKQGNPRFEPDLILLNETDAILKSISLRNGVDYVSPIEILCTKGSCIDKVGEKPNDLISFDGQHVSKSGAGFFIDKIQGKILAHNRGSAHGESKF